MNTKAQHTPGPWKHWEHADSSGLCIGPPYSENWMCGGNDAGFRVHDVCTISGSGRRDSVTDQQRANARLIAAAPELLFALSQIVSELPAKRDWLNPDIERIAKEALKKATA